MIRAERQTDNTHKKQKSDDPKYSDYYKWDRMKVTARHLAAGGRCDHTWTFNIAFLAVWLSGGKSAINNRPTLSWHVEEGTTTEGEKN